MSRLLVLSPILPSAEELDEFLDSLGFLRPEYELVGLDPLQEVDTSLPQEGYYRRWREILAAFSPRYEGLVGFSFGGMILQQCLPVLRGPLVLISTPSFAAPDLAKGLGRVAELCAEGRVAQALTDLYRDVHYPKASPERDWSELDLEEAGRRMGAGLRKVLATDSREFIASSQVKTLHLIGERSRLVNRDNVAPPTRGRLVEIPGAGMRLLSDAPALCRRLIREFLR